MEYCWFEDSRISDGRIDVSQHFLTRIDSRSTAPIRNVNHFVSLALRKGQDAESFSGREKRYLESKNNSGCRAVAYNGYCLILNDKKDVCITVYPLPKWFGSKTDASHKQKVRDMRAERLEEMEQYYQ